MQAREDVRREAHAANATLPATVKYYGKWPFRRVLGMQVRSARPTFLLRSRLPTFRECMGRCGLARLTAVAMQHTSQWGCCGTMLQLDLPRQRPFRQPPARTQSAAQQHGMCVARHQTTVPCPWQEIASVLCSLANLAAHAHCLVRFLALLRRLPRALDTAERVAGSGGGSPWPGGGRHDLDGGYSLGRPGSPVRAQLSKQPSGSRLGGKAPAANGRHSAGGTTTAAASGGSTGGAGVGQSLRALSASYTFWPLWLGYGGLAVVAWAASAAFHARDVRATEVADYLIADALILYGFLVTLARVLG